MCNWKVLAPVDLVDNAEAAAQHAMSFAEALEADLHVCYAGTVGHASTTIAGIPVHQAGTGKPTAAAIAAHADDIDADLILMTSQRYGRWSRFLRRSVTQQVMKLSRRPVCVTSTLQADGDFRFRTGRILCVAGLDGRDREMLRQARKLSDSTGAELILLHVVPPAGENLLSYAIESPVRPLSVEVAALELNALVYGLGVRALTSVMVGDAAKCISLAAIEHSADLVVISRARPPSPAAYEPDLQRILNRLRCPMLTVPVHGSTPVRSYSALEGEPAFLVDRRNNGLAG